MRVLISIICVCALLLLLGFNYYQFNRASATVAVLTDIDANLNHRGRQRYQLQLFHSQLLSMQAPRENDFRAIENTDFFTNPHLLQHRDLTAYSWENLDQLNTALDKIKDLQNSFYRLSFAQESTITNLGTFKRWVEEANELLDEIQTLEVTLSRFLSQHLVSQQGQAIVTNASAMLLIFGLFFATFIVYNYRQLQVIEEKNVDLMAKQSEMLKSRQLMASLMADAAQERESALYNAEQLLQRNREMEQFIYTVSHDLKSPLVAINGFAQHLYESLTSELTDKQRHQFQRIGANLEFMESLLGDLLQLSRIVRQDVEKTELDTEALINDVISANNFDNKAFQIQIESPLPKLIGNKRLLFQCFQNLINNAYQYRHAQREPTLTIQGGRDENSVYIAFKDNGMGIEDQHHEKIFNIFERLGHGDGSGVGLSIVKAIVEKHGGKVTLDSTFQSGSTFTLHFPDKES